MCVCFSFFLSCRLLSSSQLSYIFFSHVFLSFSVCLLFNLWYSVFMLVCLSLSICFYICKSFKNVCLMCLSFWCSAVLSFYPSVYLSFHHFPLVKRALVALMHTALIHKVQLYSQVLLREFIASMPHCSSWWHTDFYKIRMLLHPTNFCCKYVI